MHWLDDDDWYSEFWKCLSQLRHVESDLSDFLAAEDIKDMAAFVERVNDLRKIARECHRLILKTKM